MSNRADASMNEPGFFVDVKRTGLVIFSGHRGDAFEMLSDADCEIEDYDEAMEALNRDWHCSFHKTEQEAIELAHEGVYCHGRYYHGKY